MSLILDPEQHFEDSVSGQIKGVSFSRFDNFRKCKYRAKLLYVETDPVYEQFNVALGDAASLGFIQSHDVLFTYGENLGALTL